MNHRDEHEDEEQLDQLAVLRADIDQMLAMAPEVARSAYGMYAAFVAEGFAETQALYLTATQLKDTPGQPPD